MLDLIVGNAKNWGHTTFQILDAHYTKQLDIALGELVEALPANWTIAFQVAGKWARRDPPRLQEETPNHAEAKITACGLENLDMNQTSPYLDEHNN